MGRRKINRCQMSSADWRSVLLLRKASRVGSPREEEEEEGAGERGGAGSWGCGSAWHGIVDGRVGCLDVALGVIDGGRVDGWKVGRSMHG